MRFAHIALLAFGSFYLSHISVFSQSLAVSNDFSLGSPFSEPDGRNDAVRINETDIVTLAKVRGNQSGKSDFLLERYNAQLKSVWQVPLAVDVFEDYKDIYFNGKEVVLLSVVHKQEEKKTQLEAYAFDIKDGKKVWMKELETYQVGDWETHSHKGRVKESFIDLICEHGDQDFITPFEYKHNIQFSPDQSKFISYVYNYGEPKLTASVSIYDNNCNLLSRGKISIDNDYTNYGFYINNKGQLFILNANGIGRVNLIRYDLESRDFTLLDLPSSTYEKDDFQVHFLNDDEIYVGNSEVKDGKIYGVMYSKFNFAANAVDLSVYQEFDAAFRNKLVADRKNNRQMRGDEDWMDYDITHFFISKEEEVLMVLEKRALHADGYPHIGRSVFDKSHKIEFTGHVQAETIILLAFDKETQCKWKTCIFKNQVYPVNDGLNTISFVLDNSDSTQLRFLYANSESFDGTLHNINFVVLNPQNGSIVKSQALPNDDKLTLVKDYSVFMPDNSLIIVGKKGVLGKSSIISKYKL